MGILGTSAEIMLGGHVQRVVGHGQSYIVQRGQATFTTTSLSISIPTNLKSVRNVSATACATALALGLEYNSLTLGTISATVTHNILVPVTGTVTAVRFVTTDAITANDTNYWTFALINKSAADAAVLAATDANTTKATGGSGTTAYTARSLTLGAGTSVTAGDDLLLTITKTASASNMTAAHLLISIQTASGDEVLYWGDTPDASGLFYPTGTPRTITIKRASQNPTSALQFNYEIVGNE